MHDINTLGRSFIVLSYGRSGSMLLANNIGRNLGTYPMFSQFPADFLQTPIDGKSVTHCHLMLTAPELSNYRRIFSLRKNPIDTLISTILASHYRFYHQFTHTDRKELEPFKEEYWAYIDCLCNDYIKWHLHYALQLTPEDFVVEYETMIDKLSNPDRMYSKTYPDKASVLLNYHDIVAYITENHLSKLSDINQLFSQHTNPGDIYKYIDVV